MGTKTYNNYEDLITFSRASAGYALRPVSYGSELVTNGDFSTDSDWTKGTGWSIGSGVATKTAGTGSNLQATSFTGEVGKIYQVKYDLTLTAGAVNLTVLGVITPNASSSGSYTHNIVATTSSGLRVFANNTAAGTIDNISVKEVTFDESDGTLTLFEHPDNIPRVEYDADGNRLGLLVEESRTNLITQSDASAWTVASATKTVSSATSLSAFTGATGASQGATWNRLRIPSNVSVTSGTTYTVTAFYKYGTSESVLLNFRDVSGAQESRITGSWGSLAITGGAAGTLTILDEVSLPEGVKKVVVKYVPDFSGSFEFGIGANSTTSGETVIALAAQLEQASFGTSYIKSNSGSTTTRSADVASIPVADFGYNQSAGTLFVDFDMKYEESGSAFPRVVEIASESSIADRIKIQLTETTEVLAAQTYVNFNVQGTCGLGARTGGSIDSTKVAFAFREADFAASDNGDTAVTDTTGTFAPSVGRDTLAIGKQTNASSNFLNGHIKKLMYIPRRVTNAQLISLTE